LRRLNGEALHATLPFPDEVSALVLKALATRVRDKATDTTDIWRCLEIALAARVVPQDFSRSGRDEAATVIRTAQVARRCGTGVARGRPLPYQVDPSHRLSLFRSTGHKVDALSVFAGTRPYSLVLVSGADVRSLRL
jgi:hypothetical protein